MNFIIKIASVPDRERLVAEIWWGRDMVAELHYTLDNQTIIDIYPPETQKYWSFEFEVWNKIILDAKERLDGYYL